MAILTDKPHSILFVDGYEYDCARMFDDVDAGCSACRSIQKVDANIECFTIESSSGFTNLVVHARISTLKRGDLMAAPNGNLIRDVLGDDELISRVDNAR
jgi:hypothetical protein